MNIVIGNYRISPYRGNTCWKIEEKAESDASETGWKESRYYPNSLSSALSKVRELSQKDLSKEQDLDLKSAISALESLDAEFVKAVKAIPSKNMSDYS